MQIKSLKTIYQAALSITLLFATSNLFTVFAITAQRPVDGEKIRQTNNGNEPRRHQDDAELTLGKPIERSLAGNEAHSYKIVLAVNQYLHVVVEQRGIDVVVTLFAPDGKKIVEVDSFNGSQGPEPVSMVAEAAGSYRLEVRPLEAEAEAGRYQVKVEELRAANPQDRSRIAAQQALTEGAQLESEGSADSLRKAIGKYEEALPLWRSANDRAKEAETLNYIGFFYDMLSEKQKALDFYTQAFRLFRTISDDSGEALTLTNIGIVYNSLGEKQKALDFYNQALLLRRRVGDRRDEATTLNNIGVVYDSLGEKQKALDFYNQALPLYRAVGNRSGEALTLTNIGIVYNSLGEKQKALDFYYQALQLSQLVGDKSGEAITLNNIGMVYHALGEKQKALDFFKQVLPLMRAFGNRSGEATTLNNIGLVYFSQGEKQKALDFYNQSLPLTRANGDRADEADTLYNIAFVARDQGNFEESLAQIEAALVIIESLRTKITSQELRSSYFATVQNIYELYIDILMRLNKQHPARGYDAKAIQASERARARSLLETLSEANADIRRGIDPTLLEHERSIQKLLAGKSERLSRISNDEKLKAQKPAAEKEVNDLLAQYQEVEQLLAGKSERLSRISNDEKLKAQKPAAEKEVNDLLAQYQEIEAQIRVKSPRYAALTQPVPANLQEIQQLLDKDTVLLEYALGEERSYLWLVTPQSLKSYELPKRSQIEETANRVIIGITGQNNVPPANNIEYQKQQAYIKQAKADYPQTSAEFGKMLLGQIASEIEGKRLLIVADGVLQYVPFAALPKPVAANRTAAVSELLVSSNEIVSLPSASTLVALRREQNERGERKPYAKTVAVFADPVFDADDKRVASTVKGNKAQNTTVATRGQAGDVPSAESESIVLRSAKDVGLTNRGRLQRLVESKREAEAIRDVAAAGQTTIAIGFDASRERVMASNLAEYRIVHFATHGLLNEDNPELSGVVFSLVDEQGKEQNGFLRLHEIFNLNLPVEMVVLSACQTGLGKKIKGEGLVGLTRGFMYAGAPRVVASLWSVDDRATAELMSIFYRKMLRERLSPAAALRAAQNEIRQQKEWRSPVYWAGFVLQGEWQKIAPTGK
ncbi:MAG: CHAT domain-containing protein [Acidobacteria bacterium]|jgi:CHAT domain-containing protein/tetratricopeptide (TPR) repeat protein|nr:CHAT domain-containing protein [Acidobacteriota bacterium]